MNPSPKYTALDLLDAAQIPRMFHARQAFEGKAIPRDSISRVVAKLLDDGLAPEKLTPGSRIGIAAGSRGIRNIDIITKAVVDFVRARGADPFIFPAMGSHGGATAEGQRGILADYGITEKSMGCEIVSSMDVVEIGTSEHGRPVFMDRSAWESDGVIVPCRVKPHTSFRGKVESGICKMLTVGMGKQAGASIAHAAGIECMGDTIIDLAQVVLESGKIICALPCVENAYDQTAHIEVVAPCEIMRREPELLRFARDNMPRILVGGGDVLIVDEIGKNFGGTGADPNITGRFPSSSVKNEGAQFQRIAFLNLSEASHGNAMGCGLSDAITSKIFDNIDLNAMYANCITSRVLASARIPCIMPNDRSAIMFCIKTLQSENGSRPTRIVRIANTLQLETIMLSEAYYASVLAGEWEGLEALDSPEELLWNDGGDLITPL